MILRLTQTPMLIQNQTPREIPIPMQMRTQNLVQHLIRRRRLCRCQMRLPAGLFAF